MSAKIRRRAFITLIGGAAPRGRSRRVRSKASAFGALACSYISPLAMPRDKPGSWRSHKR